MTVGEADRRCDWVFLYSLFARFSWNRLVARGHESFPAKQSSPTPVYQERWGRGPANATSATTVVIPGHGRELRENPDSPQQAHRFRGGRRRCGETVFSVAIPSALNAVTKRVVGIMEMPLQPPAGMMITIGRNAVYFFACTAGDRCISHRAGDDHRMS